MKRILRNILSYATCDHRSRFLTRDEILNAEPVPKLLLMPRTWRGDLKPVLDAYLQQLAPLDNGITLGRTLSAEAIPHVIKLGTAWLGDFRDRMLAARDESPGAVEGTPVLIALEAVRREMGTGDRQRVADGLRRLRDAAARVGRSRDEQEHGAFSEGRRIADATGRRVADINAANSEFWNKRSATPSLDSRGRMNRHTGDATPAQRTAFRDAMHAATNAPTPREQIAALNRGAKAFWSSGEPPTLIADALRAAPAPTTIAGMNQRARAFWAGRS